MTKITEYLTIEGQEISIEEEVLGLYIIFKEDGSRLLLNNNTLHLFCQGDREDLVALLDSRL